MKPKLLWMMSVTLVALGILAGPDATVNARETLTFSNYQLLEPGNRNFWLEVIAAFEAEYGVDVETIAVPSRVYWDQILTELATGNVADIYYAGEQIPAYVAMGAVLPLDEYLDVSGYNSQYYPVQRSLIGADGKTYGVAHWVANQVLVYNRRMLADAGLRVPTTPEDLFEAGLKLTKAPQQYGFAIVDQAVTQLYEEIVKFVAGWGTHFAVDGRPTALDPRVIDALTYYKKIYDSGIHPRGVEKPILRQMQWEGRVAMRIDGIWYFGFAEAAGSPILDDLTAAPVPFPTRRNASGFGGLFIPRGSRNPALAAKFIEFVNRPEWQRRNFELTNQFPTNPDVPIADLMAQRPWFKAYYDSLPEGVLLPAPGLEAAHDRVMKAVIDTVSSILHRNQPVPDAAAQLQRRLEEIVADLTR